MKPFISAKDLAITQAAAAAFLFICVPLINVFGTSMHKTEGMLHGLGSCAAVLLSCQCIHGIYGLLRGKAMAAAKLELLLWLTAIINFMAIALGNWLYIGYRLPDEAQQWLLYNIPSAHSVLMEYKEFVSLFPLALSVCAAVLTRRVRRSGLAAEEAAGMNTVIAVLVTLMWITLLIAFVLGIGLAKLKMV
ncbi:hypothetical protein PaecuDRAFT_4731 [Paenibacillus curdlanolyticus YK9]|uniref:Uncharacterized protein n=1 Tax=Paenibacillus curdlanolyticus YK9 TaxID=717606 RepID=E0IGD8_9BACL|nr:hypothetical protein [Paenibacillus curdlanolyticus]EFM08438.1 hypothetical protein PaecuDRAFT_4731 [Paenibacillus curdlanolyticus YK9]